MLLKTILLVSTAINFLISASGRITVHISNFKNDKGVCRVCIFNSAEAFKENRALKCELATVKNKISSAVFENIPEGNYAIFVFHDANNNNKMDKNFIGIPSEGYGASKNNLPFAAAPTFEGNQFTVSHGYNYTFRIKLRNL